MNSVAALPMYGVSPALAAGWRALLADVLRRVEPAAEIVEPHDLHAFWRRPDLLLAQTCGYPYVLGLHEYVQLIATPHFDAPGCEGAHYSSLIVTRSDAPFDSIEACRGARAAFNATDSNSGYNAFRHTVAPYARNGRFFGSTLETGSHLGSLHAVAADRADVAAIDCVTMAFARDAYPELTSRLREIGSTRSSPGLPLIASKHVSREQADALRAALDETLHVQPERAQRLKLKGFSYLTAAAYDSIRQMENEARIANYARLA
ncbi:PhnD/SsuA/transferrin family substrate-binding protein [Paraburkholderia phymatum]|uniref:Putative ABC phosphate/phosphonate transporter, periplasmic ligand binding protein n=1 Tax=Paraburkholderia phymatum (strain DSM 17167 / CIP 108236 / LMG 21445 / STM815) TaxID=391038 RepID=B2JM07_PARP8|nr:PhnD/SsuA/transferrin family substrate-binding protein [Paraburkholderia phymatum]ACC72697.1 putative ABC phosphate/phosphonate transporter, periplasmic ligand binding protein [Paraburkholderia phymatum STM815]